MTHPDPSADPERQWRAARWYAELADALGEVARRVHRLSEHIARDWPDDRGRDWAERTMLLGQWLYRDALLAAELGAASSPLQVTDPGPETAPPPVAGLPDGRRSGRDPGLRLGDTAGSRVDPELGMRLAELPDPGAVPR